MKIALMTWFHYINYGTALQVFASCEYLEKLGYEVQVIQYYPEIPPVYYKSKADEFITRGKNKIYKLTHSKNILDTFYERMFKDFITHFIQLSPVVSTKEDFISLNNQYDVFICGSDQIWSPLNFNPRYFLDFVQDPERMIAYAPSLGASRIEQPGLDKKIAELTNRFHYLSVREKTGASIIRSLNGRKAEVVLDPTLLLNKEEWEETFSGENNKRPYLVTYFLRENRKYWRVVKEVARKLELDVCVIPVFADDLKMDGQKNGEKQIFIEKNVNPVEFVGLIRNASYVCTDSFHGMTFSVNFNKQFLPFKRFSDKAKDNQNSRVLDFLNAVGLKDRLYEGDTLNISKIDYTTVNTKFEALRKKSREFLNTALEKIAQEEKN